jgi:hypothetical protein
VHCRSYIAADVGLYLKRKFGVKFLFDMRGFWADEKRDGSWNINNPIFNLVYKYYKKKEAAYLSSADYIISLTEAGKEEMTKWKSYNPNIPLKVIPCCTDMEHFSLTDAKHKFKAREMLGLPKHDLVVSYLGSVGTWYMLDEMLSFFKRIKIIYPAAKFLFVTNTNRLIIESRINDLQMGPEDFIILQASRKMVPDIVKASDINISFIKPVYSKISSSPTKLGEVLSMGIPVICNSGVGDVQNIVEFYDVGYIIKSFDESEFDNAAWAIEALLKKSPSDIRNSIKDIFSLERGIQLYLSCYQHILT